MPIHAANLSQLPARLREPIDRDQQSGEQIFWLAQPIPGRFVFKWALAVIAGLVDAAIGRFVLTDSTIRWCLMGIGLPVAGIGGICAFCVWRWALNTAYLVTDRRAVIVSGTFRRPAVRSFEPASLTGMESSRRGDGGGDLVFFHDSRGTDDPEHEAVGFLGIADVDGAERAIRSLIKSASSQTRHYVNEKWGFELDYPVLSQITMEDANSDDEWPLAVVFVRRDPSSGWGLNIWVNPNKHAGALLPGSMPRGSPLNLRLRSGPGGRPTTPQEFIEQYKVGAAKASCGYTFVSAEAIEVAGWPAAMIVYAFDDASHHFREACVQALGSPVAVQFAFPGDAAHWNEMELIFRRILQSVRLGSPSQGVLTEPEAGGTTDADSVERC